MSVCVFVVVVVVIVSGVGSEMRLLDAALAFYVSLQFVDLGFYGVL